MAEENGSEAASKEATIAPTILENYWLVSS